MIASNETQYASDLFDKAVCVSVEIRKPSNRKAGDLKQIETDADHDWVSLNKKLIDAAEWDAIGKVDAKFTKMIKKYTLKSPLRAGIYLVPLALLETVNTELELLIAERQAAIDAYLAVYPDLVQKAVNHLNSQYQLADYATVKKIQSMFDVNVMYLEFKVPGSMSAINQDMYEKAKLKADSKWKEANEEIQMALRVAMHKLVQHAADRLAPTADGKKKRLNKTAIEGVEEFLSTFNAKNLTDDTQLAEIVEKARAVLAGKDVEMLRDNESLRNSVQEQFAAIASSMEAMIETAPSRRFSFDEEDEANGETSEWTPVSDSSNTQTAEPAGV